MTTIVSIAPFYREPAPRRHGLTQARAASYLRPPWRFCRSSSPPIRASSSKAQAGRAASTTRVRRLMADMLETMYAAPGHRPRRAAGRRGAARHRRRLRARRREAAAATRSPIPRSLWRSDELMTVQRGLPVAARALRRRDAARPRSSCAISTSRTRSASSRPRACSRPASSTRWIISKACCSSTTSRR